MQRMRTYMEPPVPAEQYVRYVKAERTCGPSGSRTATPNEGQEFLVPEGGSITLRLGEAPYPEYIFSSRIKLDIWVPAGMEHTVTGGHPELADVIVVPGAATGKPEGEYDVNAREAFCIPISWVLAGTYCQGDEVTFSGEAYIIAQTWAGYFQSPGAASMQLRYAINGGEITDDFQYSLFDSKQVIGMEPAVLELPITEKIPTKRGEEFYSWEVESMSALLGTTAVQVGDNYTAGDVLSYTSSGGTAAYCMVNLVANWGPHRPKFIAGGASGAVPYSYDGINWIDNAIEGVTTPIQHITWTGEEYFGCGNSGKLFYSKDGINWTWRNAPNGLSETLYTCGKVGEQFYFVGTQYVYFATKEQYDNTAWSNAQKTNGAAYVAFEADGYLYVGINNSGAWARKAVPLTSGSFSTVSGVGTNSYIKRAIAFGPDTIVCPGLSAASSIQIGYSSDLTSGWQLATISGSTAGQFGVVWADDRFVSVGNSYTFGLSDTGAEWEIAPMGIGISGTANSVVYANDLLVTAGSLGATVVSEDKGATWTLGYFPTIGTYNCIMYG